MSKMKITETIERECCQEIDLKIVTASMFSPLIPSCYNNTRFCIHCGQIWVDERYTDESGNHDVRSKRIEVNVFRTNK